eukprot:COSAG02_NODE_3520_length_6620_cov_3.440423_3_plen_95_part_00
MKFRYIPRLVVPEAEDQCIDLAHKSNKLRLLAVPSLKFLQLWLWLGLGLGLRLQSSLLRLCCGNGGLHMKRHILLWLRHEYWLTLLVSRFFTST